MYCRVPKKPSKKKFGKLWFDSEKNNSQDAILTNESLGYGSHIYLEPETSIYKWLFQLDDSQSLHRKWLFH